MKVTDLDEIFSTPARLAIVASLARGQQLTFTTLGKRTGIADGNLHVQTGKLVAAGYLQRETVRSGGRTATRFELTERGRLSLMEYVRCLHEAVDSSFAATRATAEDDPPRRKDPSQVW